MLVLGACQLKFRTACSAAGPKLGDYTQWVRWRAPIEKNKKNKNQKKKAYSDGRSSKFLLLVDPCFSLWGRASAPTGCSPRVPGRLLSRRFGTPSGEFQTLTSSSMTYLQEYHNLRATAFNRNVEELSKRAADLVESRSKFFFSAGARWRTHGL